MKIRVKGDRETEEAGTRLADMLSSRGTRRAYIAMRGEMGVGKTVFARGFASHFGIKAVKSPTYTIVNEYRGNSTKIYHFDLYRIQDSDDLESIGYHEYIENDGYSIVEWSERVPEYIPEDAIYVTIGRVAEKDDERNIEITGLQAEDKHDNTCI